ncbi:MAG: hypothetical protein HYS44_00325 [Candidatus Niyogibacteria bacterium]|nr:hypothetical protein [Candidatus Niyogibacteria bacterium]
MNPLSILGTGRHVRQIVTNDAILGYLGITEKYPKKNSDWLIRHIGIRSRSLNFDCVRGTKAVADEHVLHFALDAAREAIRNAGIRPQQIDGLYLATCTPHQPHFMATAVELKRQLGMRLDALVRQYDGGCAALAPVFLDVQSHAFRFGESFTVLIVAVNDVSSFLDRGLYMRVDHAWLSPVVFADGASATVLGPGEERHFLAPIAPYEASDGDHPLVTHLGGGAERPTSALTIDDHVYLMDGGDVRVQFGPAMGRVRSKLLFRAKLSTSDIGRWYLHQANLRLIENFAKEHQISLDRAPSNVGSFGNTVSASTLLLLHDDIENERMPNGPVIFAFVGAGMMEGGAIFMPPT